MQRLKVAGVCLLAALVVSVLGASSASAKGLLLTTPNQGVFNGGNLTWTSTNAGFTFAGDEGEEMCGSTGPVIWKLKVQQEGSQYLGQVENANQFQCALPSGGAVSIEPTPVPWSVKLTADGKAPVQGITQPIGFTAQFPDGATCSFDPPRILLRFVVGPIRPIPLEPGDPLIGYRLVRGVSSPACPRVATESLSFAATTAGPNGEEEPVFAASAKGLLLTTPNQGVFNGGNLTWTSTNAGFTFAGDEGEEMCGSTGPVIWKLKVQQEGSQYLGQVENANQVDCALPSGAVVSIEPDPHPWSVKLTRNGSALVKGIGEGIGFTAQFPDGATCSFDPPRILLRFVVGPIRPIPLEPGDPLIGYRLVRGVSSPACPRVATESLSFAATTAGPNGEEEPVLAQDY